MLSLHFLNLTAINFLTLNVLVVIFFCSLVLFAMFERLLAIVCFSVSGPEHFAEILCLF